MESITVMSMPRIGDLAPDFKSRRYNRFGFFYLAGLYSLPVQTQHMDSHFACFIKFCFLKP